MIRNGLRVTPFKGHFGNRQNNGSLYSSVCLHCQQSKSKLLSPMNVPVRLNSSGSYTKKSHPIRNTFLALGITTGGIIAYAEYDPNVEKILTENIPGFNEVFNFIQDQQRFIKESSAFVSGLFSGLLGSEEQKPDVPKVSVPPKKLEKEVVSKQEAVIVAKPLVASELPKPAVEGKEKFSVKVSEVDEEIRVSASTALIALKEANTAVKEYGNEISTILEKSVGSGDSSFWANVKSKTLQKEKLVSTAERAVSDARENLNKVKERIENSELPLVDREHARHSINAALDQLDNARRELEAQKQRNSVTDRYWNKVEQSRKYFQEELESLFPKANLTGKELNISSNELDLFLMHVVGHVLFYQRELARLESFSEQKIRQAFDQTGEHVNEQLIQLRVQQAVEKERRKLEEELQKKLLITRNEQEKELKLQLKRQLETAQDHLNDLLSAKEADLERRVARKVDEKQSSECANYELKLTKMLSQLKALEVVLDERVEADRKAHQAHVLFGASQSLFRALRTGVPGVHWSEQLRPLNPEIAAVSNATGGKDQLVSTVLSAVPQEARSRGVYPEPALRERFLRVEQVAKRVALIPSEGGSLFRYLLSYLQSSLIFSSASTIPLKEIKDEPIDISKLNTYDLLQRARYWVDRGDLKMSLRYMNLLQGAPRAVASEWMEETRIYLETQLIANTLMAHAAATSLLYL